MSGDDPERRRQIIDFCSQFGIEGLSVESTDLALRHRSYSFEHGELPDNERLEFLGDAVISAICSEFLFEIHPDAREGELSKRRAHLVSRQLLGRRADAMGLGPLMQLGRGERLSGGEKRDSVLGSALEALVGIIYLKLGFNQAATFTREHILQPIAQETHEAPLRGDFKSALQEWSQKKHGMIPLYHLVSESGPDHAKEFCVEVEINGERVARGAGRRIKTAENEAARLALLKLQEIV